MYNEFKLQTQQIPRLQQSFLYTSLLLDYWKNGLKSIGSRMQSQTHEKREVNQIRLFSDYVVWNWQFAFSTSKSGNISQALTIGSHRPNWVWRMLEIRNDTKKSEIQTDKKTYKKRLFWIYELSNCASLQMLRTHIVVVIIPIG